MGRKMVMDSWFSGSESNGKVLGILAFEVAGLMSKVVNLWHFLDDGEMLKLRKQITNSIGIRRLVSDNENYLMDLALNEIINNFGTLATSVARLGKKCTDPVYHSFENLIKDPISNNSYWLGWEYRLKKMERKVKKMERFVAVTMQLTRELEVLAEQERTLRRMRRNAGWDRVKLFEFEKKIMLQRQEVKNLRKMSPWVRTNDYVVRILLRSLLTMLERIKYVFRNNQMVLIGGNKDFESISSLCFSPSDSFSARPRCSAYPSDNNKSEQISGKQLISRYQLIALHGKMPYSKTIRSSRVGVGPFKKCMSVGSNSPIVDSCTRIGTGPFRFIGAYTGKIDKLNKLKMESVFGNDKIYSKLSVFDTKCLLDAPMSTLGDAALALRYAHIIVLIEKLASAPHMIGLDARDDLYNMLPSTLRTALLAKLKSNAKTLASLISSASVSAERSLVLVWILGWLAPLAHNMIRWHSERSFKEQHMVSRSNVLLVQTLHFANRAKTEAAITELLVGLNYVCRVNRAHNNIAF
ncbi:cytochrome P450 76A2-like [Hibiscus syriacus]|uniref:Cytochrome P450 76A2-like n=1 Tax=Hibiscus syriacus TaxID=106335 RepID=A0A6A2Y2T0_HIBSY|nr:protein PSK SIMULATOR 1-like [Hibiscus syriacus]KAE8666279.1 cytochrome P450 76A2-like [Hibiscus syriacus]